MNKRSKVKEELNTNCTTTIGISHSGRTLLREGSVGKQP